MVFARGWLDCRNLALGGRERKKERKMCSTGDTHRVQQFFFPTTTTTLKNQFLPTCSYVLCFCLTEAGLPECCSYWEGRGQGSKYHLLIQIYSVSVSHFRGLPKRWPYVEHFGCRNQVGHIIHHVLLYCLSKSGLTKCWCISDGLTN